MIASAYTVSELARATGTPVSSIKYYLRVGLLAGGDRDAPGRGYYGVAHLERLRLIRALREVGGLGIPAIQGVCASLDGAGGGDVAATVARVLDAVGGRTPRREVAGRAATTARREVRTLLEARRVRVRRDARAVVDLADALVGLRSVLGPEVGADAFVPYLDAMCALATRDFEAHRGLLADAATSGVAATYATVLWEPVLLLLRRVAYEHVAATRLTHPRPTADDRGRR